MYLHLVRDMFEIITFYRQTSYKINIPKLPHIVKRVQLDLCQIRNPSKGQRSGDFTSCKSGCPSHLTS